MSRRVRVKLPLLPPLSLGSAPDDPPEEPIRAELFGIARLEQHAQSLAAAQHVFTGVGAGRPLLARVEQNGQVLRDAHREISEAIQEERWITPAAEWLVDNFHVVDEQLREIREDLPAAFYRELPKLIEGPLIGFPRVYGIAWAFVAHTDSRFDPDTLRRFVLAYQRVQPLTIGELWAIAISLRVVLVENLRRIADAIVRRREARRAADAFVDDLLGVGQATTWPFTYAEYRDESVPLVAAFAVELVQRLRDHDPAVTPALAWLHRRLAAQGTTADEIALLEHQRQAALTVTVRNTITSMRELSALDWKEFFESVSLVDEVLQAHCTYRAMDFATRDSYRHAIETLARRSSETELLVAKGALSRAARAHAEASTPATAREGRRADPGYYLIGAGRRAFEREIGFVPPPWLKVTRLVLDRATPWYLGSLALLTAVILAVPLLLSAVLGVNAAGLVALGLVALVPSSDLAVALLNRAVSLLVPPSLPPRLELREGVPAEHRTLVAVPTLLSTRAEVDELIDRLEVHHLANADGDIRFALLSDWRDAPAEHAPGDEEFLSAAREGIARLNARYGRAPDESERFMLLHRRRLWNAREGKWMGWERKRGKLHELNRLLRGATDTTFLGLDGAAPVAPEGVRYVVTLDADTRLPIGALKRLVGTMAHPLNRPQYDESTRRVVEGHAVLQPRVTPPLPGRAGSWFQRLASGPAGIDPYAAAVSDVYQDLFGEGSYTGKGIYDVDAFESALDGRVPENSLLSHDLYEGVCARAGLVTDIELFEATPALYLAATARQHRWARGDWQLLPRILREPLPAIGRWKMIDNLRRTLSMPAAFLTLVLGWTLPSSPAVLWTVFVVAVLAWPAFLPVFAGVVPRAVGVSKRSHLRAIGHDFWFAVGQTLLTITMMAHQAWLMTDAIIRTLVRVFITHRKLLEWVPAEHVALRSPFDLGALYRRMAGGLVLAAIANWALMWYRPFSWPVAFPILLLWGLSPAVARWVSLPGAAGSTTPLSTGEATTLRLIARRTWRFFTEFVTADSSALPPDNFQETPKPVIAQRTSPTNIGLYLLSAVSAHDFGWIGAHDLSDRIDATLRSVERLEHHRGHLLNWYDTRDGRPLEPRYVSSVDSGNLAGCLIALANACSELIETPAPAHSALSGIEDSAQLFRLAVRAMGEKGGIPSPARRRLEDALDVVFAVVTKRPTAPADWVARVAELETSVRTAADCAKDLEGISTMGARTALATAARELVDAVETHARDLDLLMPWARLRVDDTLAPFLEPLATMPSLAELPPRAHQSARGLRARRATDVSTGSATPASLRNIDALLDALEKSATAATALRARLSAHADTARAMVAAMEFGFLFDHSRMLFAIGYRVSDGSLDPGRYDLLASEARLMSFVAIAKGDVPVDHWFRLGRPLTPVGEDSVLLSWSGSMFEYLMPGLVLRSPVGSLVEQTCRLVVRRQMRYGEERGVPWGVSESGYYVRDLEMTYQYANFGVPGLGLKRGLGDDVVISPYATALAAMVEPVEAVRNFEHLVTAGADGAFGFYEALDYTASRLPAGAERAVVHTYMAHHQGMVIVSLANVLNQAVMRARFHAEPTVRASELLLQERTPRDVAVARPRVESVASVADVRELVPPQARRFSTPHGPISRTHLLSNGRYAVMLTAAGSGYSRWRDIAVTRWREDPTCDAMGSYIFLRDVASGDTWSAGYQPTGADPDAYEVSFSEDRAEFLRRDHSIATRLEVIVSSEDDAEVRRVSLTNHGARAREIEVTSYAEIVLAPAAADAAHPAFSNLFVQSESFEERDTLFATRRPRSAEEAPVWLAHVLAVEGETVGDLQWETDRAQFLGRGRTVRNAQAMAGVPLSNTEGSVLDPIVSLRRRVLVRPGKTVRVMFSTVVGSSQGSVRDLADKYHDVTTFERAATLAWTHAQVQLHHLGVAPDEAQLFQTLGGSILYGDRTLRASPDALTRLQGEPAALWAHGISGDLPIVVVQIDEADDVGVVRQLLRAHEYWRLKQLAVDLVILNDRAPSYLQDLQALLETLVRTSQSMPRHDGQDSGGQVFILRADRVSAAQREVLEGVAHAVLSSRRGSLAEQVARAHRSLAAAVGPPRAPVAAPATSAPQAVPADLTFFNGIGGFAAHGREYVTIVRDNQWTPAPWINVLANPDFGCLVSEAGTGCTWSINSRENQLTPWSNDPVSDPPSEAFYIRDDETGDLWSPTPLPVRRKDSEYLVRHGFGFTRHEHQAHGISSELLQFVPADDPVKVARLTLTNVSHGTRRLTVTAYVEWVLGVSRTGSAPFVVTELDLASGALFARNSWSRDFGARIAFADMGGAQMTWTTDRTEFLGRNGSREGPAALSRRERLSGRTGAGLDPCCALQTVVELAPGATIDVLFVLGQAATREGARELVARYHSTNIDASLRVVTDRWQQLLDKVSVATPDRALDLLLNGWLLYQTLAARLWARAGFYQASGAYGYRDQLQDVMALVVTAPEISRAQILRAASRQFAAGDVQHWWHEPAGRGVRTRFSDDRLWLPYVTSHYLDVARDRSVLDDRVPFLDGPLLRAGQSESYFEPRVTHELGTVFEHCAKAIDSSLAVGAHGLPLMGGGDWNDGMNRVGAEGRGESVWLGWFLFAVLEAWAPIAESRGETARAAAWTAAAKALQKAIERDGWDGHWYRRAYFDDGTPLGSITNDECSIDSIAQSWSVISRGGEPGRARLAMASLDERLIRRADRLNLLLAPPFDKTALEPGYIKGYVPGVRENGGQYTHSAAWSAIAFAELGDGARTAEVLALLNPILLTSTPGGVQHYKVEPYVVAGDVYSQPPHVGRGGWSWYTGSAGWVYRAGVEWLLGLRVRGATFTIDPCIPPAWPGFSITLRHGAARYDIAVENPREAGRGVTRLEVDGADHTGRSEVALADEGVHWVRVVLG